MGKSEANLSGQQFILFWASKQFSTHCPLATIMVNFQGNFSFHSVWMHKQQHLPHSPCCCYNIYLITGSEYFGCRFLSTLLWRENSAGKERCLHLQNVQNANVCWLRGAQNIALWMTTGAPLWRILPISNFPPSSTSQVLAENRRYGWIWAYRITGSTWLENSYDFST